MTFEDDLRRSLRRVAPPAGFAARVTASAVPAVDAPRARREASKVPAGPGPGTRWWFASGLAASLMVAAGAGVMFLDRHREAEARLARDQVLQALRLTSAELRQINARVASHARD